MLSKLAFSQKVLRALAGEKTAALRPPLRYAAPVLVGGALVGSGVAIHRGLKKGREYQAGFQPGHAEQKVEVA